VDATHTVHTLNLFHTECLRLPRAGFFIFCFGSCFGSLQVSHGDKYSGDC